VGAVFDAPETALEETPEVAAFEGELEPAPGFEGTFEKELEPVLEAAFDVPSAAARAANALPARKQVTKRASRTEARTLFPCIRTIPLLFVSDTPLLSQLRKDPSMSGAARHSFACSRTGAGEEGSEPDIKREIHRCCVR
jgi:hypothetical protein